MQKLNLILEDILKQHDRQCSAFLFLTTCKPPFLLVCEVENKLKLQLFLPKKNEEKTIKIVLEKHF